MSSSFHPMLTILYSCRNNYFPWFQNKILLFICVIHSNKYFTIKQINKCNVEASFSNAINRVDINICIRDDHGTFNMEFEVNSKTDVDCIHDNKNDILDFCSKIIEAYLLRIFVNSRVKFDRKQVNDNA